eukprot:556188-Amorphochlora_amoeboformis.AAC.1
MKSNEIVDKALGLPARTRFIEVPAEKLGVSDEDKAVSRTHVAPVLARVVVVGLELEVYHGPLGARVGAQEHGDDLFTGPQSDGLYYHGRGNFYARGTFP